MLKIVPVVTPSPYGDEVFRAITKYTLVYEVRLFGFVILRTLPVNMIACEVFTNDK